MRPQTTFGTSDSTGVANHPGWNSESRHQMSTSISSSEALGLVNEVHRLRIAEMLHRDWSLAAQ